MVKGFTEMYEVMNETRTTADCYLDMGMKSMIDGDPIGAAYAAGAFYAINELRRKIMNTSSLLRYKYYRDRHSAINTYIESKSRICDW